MIRDVNIIFIVLNARKFRCVILVHQNFGNENIVDESCVSENFKLKSLQIKVHHISERLFSVSSHLNKSV